MTAQKIIGKSIPAKIAGNLAQEGGQVLLVSTAKHIATKFPRSAIAGAAPVAAEAIGAGLGAGIEGITMSYDIYKKHKDLKRGQIDSVKFKKYVARRVTRGVNSVAGGVAGSVIGQMVIPVPVVGAVVGGIVGGIVGAAVGHGEGILLGELVQVIDAKLKENKAYSAERDDAINDEAKFQVIDKLVFKFDKDVLQKNFANDNEREEQAVVIREASAKISDEDYEIYVLNDTDEILTELSRIDESVNERGLINKRASLEAFTADQLPANINVFFKILEEE